MVGVTIFYGGLLLLKNRKHFVIFVGALVVIWAVSPFIQTVFWDIGSGAPIQGAQGIDTAGSGRPYIWRHNLALYADWPIEQQVAGIGAGNELLFLPLAGTYEARVRAWQSHNDYLSALIELGFVGLVMILVIYYFIYRNIQQIPGPERPYFLALLAAVAAMNFLSNSYLSRFGLGQLFVMVMVGVDIARHARVAGLTGIIRAPRGRFVSMATAWTPWR
jgi:O-antigen ligase